MAWVRIHDGAMSHPKILALSDSAFRLWVRGLCYCQTQLTDGLIPRAALHEMKPKRRDVEQLLTRIDDSYAPLWEQIEGFGFKVHDYLFWNDSREKVRERQVKAHKRKEDWRRNVGRNASPERVPDAVPNASLTKPNLTKPVVLKEQELRPAAARSRRPIFTGQRITVFEWMLDDLMRMLGDKVDNFDLDEWFFTADAKAMKLSVIRDDWWPWLKSETKAEAIRRGLGTEPIVDKIAEQNRKDAEAALALLRAKERAS